MDIYKKRSYWNMALALFGMLIVAITIVYSSYLARELKEREEKNAFIYTYALKEFLNTPSPNSTEIKDALNEDIKFLDTVTRSFDLPIIVEYSDGYLEGNNWGAKRDTNQVFLASMRKEFMAEEKVPIEGFATKVYYFNSRLYEFIKYFPLIQIFLVGSFIMLGYFFLTGSKKSEQSRVWAGMAKETAHQLGTPISAIIAWIEHLKLTEPTEEQTDIIHELRRDVNRLELVADRFSKIGSAPVLTPVNIYEEMDKCRAYMERRAPRKVIFNYPNAEDGNITVKINRHLFDWVIENLIRNSLDAMESAGELTAHIYEDERFVNVDMADTGKGIPISKFSTVFEPGYSTKQRGWGLGLSLAKRIIENYHKGKIYVKTSKIGEGTTFSIRLPKA